MHFRGQASTEALIVMGFAVILVFVLVYAVFPVMVDFAQFSESAQAERSLSRIAGTVDAASAYGPGTSTTLFVYLPRGTLSYENKVLSFRIESSKTEITKRTVANVEIRNRAAKDANTPIDAG
ncbi:MAG: hypothetical protein N3G76_00550, partial [Candidatus Micrarchaeota archaeon]|nr:hypothetical protein [Candidatus Micrarchaeota archaeon]